MGDLTGIFFQKSAFSVCNQHLQRREEPPFPVIYALIMLMLICKRDRSESESARPVLRSAQLLHSHRDCKHRPEPLWLPTNSTGLRTDFTPLTTTS
jgi:hypothetical protein